MDYLHEIGWYFNLMSARCDNIRKLDMDKYKQYTDKEILEELLTDKIMELKYQKALEEILALRKSFENVDEWVEAEAFEKAEKIAMEALESEEI